MNGCLLTTNVEWHYSMLLLWYKVNLLYCTGFIFTEWHPPPPLVIVFDGDWYALFVLQILWFDKSFCYLYKNCQIYNIFPKYIIYSVSVFLLAILLKLCLSSPVSWFNIIFDINIYMTSFQLTKHQITRQRR